jgi:hypothetical protein
MAVNRMEWLSTGWNGCQQDENGVTVLLCGAWGLMLVMASRDIGIFSVKYSFHASLTVRTY